MDNHQHAYREEAYELLTELETSLLELEEIPDDEDQIDRVFRAMHTIKGSSAMFGFDEIAAFTHDIETVFDRVRSGDILVTKELVSYSLEARDQIIAMLGASSGGDPVDESKSDVIIEKFKSLLPQNLDQHTDSDEQTSDPDEQTFDSDEQMFDDTDNNSSIKNVASYRIRFKPHEKIFIDGTDPFQLIHELHELGDMTVVAQTDTIPTLDQIIPENCYMHWDIILTTNQGLEAIRDIFIFIEDACELSIDIIDDIEEKKLGEILIERKDITTYTLLQTLNQQKRLGEMLLDSKAVNQCQINSALAEQNHIRQMKEKRNYESQASSIRVDATKLDILVDLVGELVTVQASLSQKATTIEDPELLAIAEQVERLTADLRDNTMGIRMLPISTTFSKFKRLIRDLSNELGKDVVMKTEGGTTELDKKVIERLNDPMVHIIRNSIDHGIESPDIRQKSGKNKTGTISLVAIHSGANVLIKISDDGAGIDPEAIRNVALKKGIISPDIELSENETYNLLFAPGFSTAKTISDVSGRGVGMDVVKSSIDALRGSIDIDSEIGVGTTITLKLPLTLAIIDGLLVDIGGEFYVIPLPAVEECIEISNNDRNKSKGRNITWVRDEIVPYIPLRELFDVEKPPPEIEQVVIVKVDNTHIGLVVDNIIGEYQTVIKSLGRIYQSAKEFSGATILADGSVALILDVHRLSQLAVDLEQEVLELN